MVISGGNFKPDSLKPKEVVSLLLDDEEIEQKCELMCNIILILKRKNQIDCFIHVILYFRSAKK